MVASDSMELPADTVRNGMATTEYRPDHVSDRVIVLLSSLGVSRRCWSSAAPALAEKYRCLAIDIPGHGESEPAAHFMTIQDFAEAIGAMLEAERLNDVVLVGNSLGATICTELAATRPDLVSHLVHVGSAIWESEPARRAWLHSRSTLFCSADGMPHEMTEDFVVGIFGAYDAERHRMLKEDQKRAGPRLGWAMWALYAYDTYAALRKVRQPVLAIFGENDLYRQQTLPLLHRAAPLADEVIVAGGGHLLPVDRGPQLAGHILDWLETTPY